MLRRQHTHTVHKVEHYKSIEERTQRKHTHSTKPGPARALAPRFLNAVEAVNTVGSDELVANTIDSVEPVANAVDSVEPVENIIGSVEPVENTVGIEPVANTIGIEPVENTIGSDELVENTINSDELVANTVCSEPIANTICSEPIANTVCSVEPVENTVCSVEPVETYNTIQPSSNIPLSYKDILRMKNIQARKEARRQERINARRNGV